MAVPTLADVARAAGVSTATVSRCLNAPDRVVPATRARVMAAVEALHYTPNFGARALAARRTNTVGAVIPTMENAIFARGVQAFQETLNALGVTLLVASSLYRPELEREQIRTLIGRGVDGVMLIGHQRPHEIYQMLSRRGIAAVVTWAVDPAGAAPSVGFDNRAAMQALTEAVIAQGHRRIGVISADTASNDRARERVAGVRAALARTGLPDADPPIVETTYSFDAGARAFGALMALDRPPTAVICGNDVLAVGAIQQARRDGLSPPRDVSITGFDDIEVAQVVDPPLTTVRVPHREMGVRAARALLEMIETGARVDGRTLPTEIVFRGSLGPPPGRP